MLRGGESIAVGTERAESRITIFAAVIHDSGSPENCRNASKNAVDGATLASLNSDPKRSAALVVQDEYRDRIFPAGCSFQKYGLSTTGCSIQALCPGPS